MSKRENPIHHVNKMQQLFKEQIEHLRKDIKEIDDPRCKALFEVSAEVLLGLVKACEDYKNQEEEAWQP